MVGHTNDVFGVANAFLIGVDRQIPV